MNICPHIWNNVLRTDEIKVGTFGHTSILDLIPAVKYDGGGVMM